MRSDIIRWLGESTLATTQAPSGGTQGHGINGPRSSASPGCPNLFSFICARWARAVGRLALGPGRPRRRQ